MWLKYRLAIFWSDLQWKFWCLVFAVTCLRPPLRYTLQGIPLGLGQVLPLILKDRGASFTELGVFSLQLARLRQHRFFLKGNLLSMWHGGFHKFIGDPGIPSKTFHSHTTNQQVDNWIIMYIYIYMSMYIYIYMWYDVLHLHLGWLSYYVLYPHISTIFILCNFVYYIQHQVYPQIAILTRESDENPFELELE